MGSTRVALVTGAAGSIGSSVVEQLLRAGVPVRATDRPGADRSLLDRLGVELVEADLTDAETLPKLFEGGVDRVFHLGAICNFSTPYHRLYPVNVIAVERITGLALAAKVARFVHVSSTAVYGPYRGSPFTERDDAAPRDSYGMSKHAGECAVWRRISEGLPAVIARPCMVYGPRCTAGAGKVFSRPTSIPAVAGSGQQRLSNVRSEDVAAALLHLSVADGAVGQAYNIADDSHPTLEAALGLAASAFGRKAPRRHISFGVLRVAVRAYALVCRLRRKIPDVEPDALEYLADDYLIDNAKLKATGFRLQYPDFSESLRQLGAAVRPAS